MSATRDIEVTIRITGDIGIPDAQVISAINRLLDLPPFRIAEVLEAHGIVDDLDDACPSCGTRIQLPSVVPALVDLLPAPGRWKVVVR